MAPFAPTVTVQAAFGYGPSDGAVTWTDLTTYRPRDVSISRGRPSELDRFATGSCSLTLTDPDRDLDPTNLSGPFVETYTTEVEFPLYVGAVANEASTSLGTNNAFTLPADVVVGDLLLAYVAVDLNGGAGGIATGTGSATWTELFDAANGTIVRHALYARIATGSDALVLTGPTEDYVVQIIRVGKHGCATTADIQVGTTVASSGTGINPPSLNAGSSQKWLWIALGAVDCTSSTLFTGNVGTGFTVIDQEISAVSTSSVGLTWAWMQEETTTKDPGTMPTNFSRDWVANTIAIPQLTSTADRSQIVTGTPIRVVAELADGVEVLNDTAAGPGLHSDWRVTAGAVTAAISGAYTIPVGTTIESARGYNFDGPASFQFGTASDGASPNHDILIYDGAGNSFGWNLTATTLTYMVNFGGSTADDTVTWNDTNHRYLRITIDGEDLIWERSADGSSWTTIDTYTRGSDFTDVDWSFGRIKITNNSASTTPQFDDFVVTASHFTQFTGNVDRWPWRPLPGKAAGVVDVQASDAFARLSQVAAPSIWQETVRSHDPRVWYQLSETTGITVSDSSGNGYHGTAPYVAIELGVDPPSPRVGGSGVRFPERNTVNGIYVPPAARITAIPYTWAAWVQASVAFSNQAADAFDNLKAMVIYTQASTGDSFALQVAAQARSDVNETDASNPVVQGWVVSVVSQNPTDGLTVNAYQASLEDTLPHHLAWSVDSSGNGTLYIDGQPASVYETFAGFAGSMLGTFIGNDWTTPGSPNAYSFPGTIDEVMVLDSDLSATEVLDLYQAGWAPGDGDTTGERVSRFLDLVNWPPGLRIIDPGEVTMGPADPSNSVLAVLQDAEKTEGGRLFIGPHGEVVFHDRGRCDSRSTSPVLYDTAGSGVDLLGDGFTVVSDDSFLYTSASVQRPGGSPQVFVDDDARTRFGDLTYSDTILTRTDQEAYIRAAGVVGRYKAPQPRFEGWTVAPEKDPALWWQVLNARLGDSVQLTFQLLGSGDTFDDILDLASMSTTISGGGWTVTMTGTPQDPALDDFFQFDASADVGFNYGVWR